MRALPSIVVLQLMTIKSMTGFARTDGAFEQVSWQWEVRTVNGRALDVRLRLPPGFEPYEKPIRELVASRLARGNVSINLQMQRLAGSSEMRINEQVLSQLLSAIDQVSRKTSLTSPSAAEILSMKGVLEWVEVDEDETQRTRRMDAMMESLAAALDSVSEARRVEGEHLAKAVAGHIDEIERLVKLIDNAPARNVDAVARRLKDGISRLLAECEQGTMDEGRLYQEAALLATKMDIEEELKRLGAHVATARDLLQSSDPVGRRLDFLAQEFNREANTVCSKSNDTGITQNALALKAVIDQMREQVQNIE